MSIRLPILAILVCALAALATIALHSNRPQPSSPDAFEQTIEREGLEIQFELRDATATLTVRDAHTGEPVRRANPRVWMSRRAGAALEDAACRSEIKKYLGGLLSVQADVDLNAAWLLVMNDDNTISVLNPHLAFSRTKLRSIVSLPGKAADWVLHPDGGSLFVSIPSTGQVSIVDTRKFQARGLVDVGQGARRLLLSPDAQRLFVTREAAGRVAVLGVEGRALLGELEVEPGRLSVSFARGGRELWVASDRAKTIRVFDALTLERLSEVEVGAGVAAIAHHDSARSLFTANAQTGEIGVIDIDTREVTARVAGRAGMSSLSFDPSGRWVLALNPGRGELQIFDAAARTLRASLDHLGRPDALTFTRDYAYVRDAESPRILLLRLDSLSAEGSPALAEVPIGQTAAGGPSAEPLEALPLTATAERNGVFVASPKDRALAYYTEGMMVPMGSLRNNGREPRAVLLLDRRLREIQPGVYRTDVELGAAGEYDVAILLDSPRLGACLKYELAPSDRERREEPRHPLAIEPAFDVGVPLTGGTRQALSFRVRDPSGGPVAPDELRVVAFRPPGTWQWRGAAQRRRDDGALEVVIPPAPAGALTVLVGVPGRGAPIGSLPPLQLAVSETLP